MSVWHWFLNFFGINNLAGYGYGFWRGVWDFVLCRKGARPSFAILTRCS